MILDLKQYVEETLDITLLDGDVVKVKKPTEKLFIDFLVYQNQLGEVNGDLDKTFNLLNDMIYAILSNNADYKKIDKDMIKDLSFEMKTAIIEAFVEFMNTLTSQKNS